MESLETDKENMNRLVMEVEPETQSLEDQTDLKLTAKTKTSCCKGLKAFIAALAFTYFSKAFSGAIMKSSITQMERRFGISSTKVGVMDGGFDLGNLLVIAFVSYFGGKFHRPRVIALGCFIMSLGSFLAAMPHFVMESYKYDTLSRPSDDSTFSISPCLLNQTVPGREEMPGSGCEKEDVSYAWIYVLMGNLLRGIGETPIIPLGVSYIDDFSRKEDAPLYVGCLHTTAMIGPMAGFLLGSLLARLYVDIGFVDLSTVTITPVDARWVGAWWLGFLVAGVTNLISGIPFLFLPKSLDTNKENASIEPKMDVVKINGDESHTENSETEQGVGCMGKLKEFFKSLKMLLGNRMYSVVLFITLLQANSFFGYVTYNPKYIEQQYSQPASKTNFVIGVAVLPVVSISMFSGGFIMKKYKLGIIRATKLAYITSLVAFLISLLYMAVGCDNRTVAGLTVSYDGQPVASDTIPLSSVCNSNCSCAPNQWDPVCGENGITYVSACFAGCKDITGFGKETVFHNCSCIEQAGSVMRNSSAVLAECQRRDNCSKKYIYFIVITVASSVSFALAMTPLFMIKIRCVSPELKSLSLGIHMFAIRAFAGIPAPTYFGAVIDRACLMWSKTSCGRRGACRIYDSNVYRNSFFGLVYGLRFPSFPLSVVFFYLVKKHFGRQEVDSNENGRKEGIPLNGEINTNGTTHSAGISDANRDTSI